MNAIFEHIKPYLDQNDDTMFITKDKYRITFDGRPIVCFQIDEEDPTIVDILYTAGRDDVDSSTLNADTFKYLQLWEEKEF